MAKRIMRAITQIIFLALFLFLVLTARTNLWLILFGASLILAIFFGRIYCGWICPINAIMRPINWIYKKLNLKRLNAPKWLRSKIIPWVMLALLVLTMVLGRILKIQIPGLLIILGLGFLFSLIFNPEVFHNYICPYGALQSLTGRFAKLGFRVDKDKCTGCGICEKYCDAEAVTVKNKEAEIYAKLCHQCSNCQIECPSNAISYRKNKL